jgi:hypothetical protein
VDSVPNQGERYNDPTLPVDLDLRHLLPAAIRQFVAEALIDKAHCLQIGVTSYLRGAKQGNAVLMAYATHVMQAEAAHGFTEHTVARCVYDAGGDTDMVELMYELTGLNAARNAAYETMTSVLALT